LLEGLQLAYGQLSRGQKVQLPPKTTSYNDWGAHLKQYAQSSKQRRELDYWLAEPPRWPERIPVDYPGGANVEGSVSIVWTTLSVEDTKLLMQEIPKAYRTMINDVLLTALVQAFARWTGSRSLLIDLENHGREEIFDDVDLVRTVGWFTCIFPLLLDVNDTRDPGAALRRVKEQIRRVPNGGIGYGLLRYLSEDAETRDRLRALPQPEVSFNYVGRSNTSFTEGALFAAAGGSAGASHSPKARRRYLLEVSGGINQGQLRMAWLYSEQLHQRKTIERLAEGFVSALKSIIDHCRSPEAGKHTPSDFLVADMEQRELDDLIAELSEIDE
jgi:non-ribosomal peptide synthase protein (TIGR01720 family)